MNRNTKTALIIGGVALALLIVAVPLIWGTADGWHGGGWGMMGGFGWWWIMPIGMILFWGLVIWAVVALTRGLGQRDESQSASGREDSALEVLKKRYARGEIGKEEYEEKRRDLV